MMRRNLSELFSLQALKQVVYVPKFIWRVKNWLPLLLNYIGIKNTPGTYFLRDGTTIIAGEGVDAATIAVIFIKHEYGTMPEDATIVDIGANIGVFALYAAASTARSHVYAYEPFPATVIKLEKNIAANPHLASRITPVPQGVAGGSGARAIHITSGSPFHSLYPMEERATGETVAITTVSLAELLTAHALDHIDLLKIDCEGAEFEIFYATPADVFGRIKEIRMEYHDQGEATYNHNDLIAFLAAQGYTMTFFRADAAGCGNAWFVRSDLQAAG